MKETQQPPVIKEADESQQAKPQNLEAYLRDSIFGDDFRNYNEKIEKLTQELENVQQSLVEVETRLLKEIAAVKAQYGDIPDNIAQRVDNRIDELISRSENDLEKLSMLINEFATDFQAQIDGLRTETQVLQNDGQSDRQALANALITIGTQLKKES
jgi:CII-binding regulator of phage lambda lysogenization HflD